MIIKFYEYNKLNEGHYFHNRGNEDEMNKQILEYANFISKQPISLIGDRVEFVSDIVDRLSDYESMVNLSEEQKRFIIHNYNEEFLVLSKYYGDEWWSRLEDNYSEDNNRWIPDRFFIKKQNRPNYNPRNIVID